MSKRAWGLKLRRGGGGEVEASGGETRPPELREPLRDVAAAAGGAARLQCRAEGARVAAWRKTAPETRALRAGGRFVVALAEGVASLTIHAVRASDAGVYTCVVSNDAGAAQCAARLTVGGGAAVGEPTARALPGGGLAALWDEPATRHLEYCRVGEAEWRRATDVPAAAGSLALEDLPAGQYSFRLVCALSGAAGPASGPAACGGGGAWQREQFARRYTVDEEIGRGRTARVFAARDTGTGQKVALKQVS